MRWAGGHRVPLEAQKVDGRLGAVPTAQTRTAFLKWGEGEPPHPTRSTFFKWGERESEAEVTTHQGEALLHRRGSWRRKFGDLAGDHAGKTEGLQVGERNSEGVLWGGGRLGGPLALLCPPPPESEAQA